MRKLQTIICALLCSCFAAGAQTAISWSDWNKPTLVTTKWFGPNAFPVPEMEDACVPRRVKAELAGDFFNGSLTGDKDVTYDAFFKLEFPLFSDRVGLSIWMPFYECWEFDESVAEARRLVTKNRSGKCTGDMYIATDIQFLEESGWRPDVMGRIVLKTATGGKFVQARNYDAAGYFMDLTLGKTLYSGAGFMRRLRLDLSGGFLCWQSDKGRQNDAALWGAMARAYTRIADFTVQLGGYVGWERVDDAPVSLRFKAVFGPDWKVSPMIMLQQGLNDWPFTQYRAGLVLSF